MHSQRLTVAVDAMGGDLAPRAIVAGALTAARAMTEIDIVLVGDEGRIRQCLAELGAAPPNLTLRHAAQVIAMHDAPGTAIRQKRDSSIAVGMRMVRDGEAHAIVSAGNTGAMTAGAILILKSQPGVDRPAIASMLPTRQGHAIVLDAGATVDCKPTNLLQFGQLGSAYVRAMFDIAAPRIGLLNVGEERGKGDELSKEAFHLLQESGLNFIGNVEPKELVRGEVDIIVCDGFVGNLLLKSAEGFSMMVMEKVGEVMRANPLNALAGMILKPGLRRMKKRYDYAEYGGMPLLGANGIVIISHGRSTDYAMANAIRMAARVAGKNLRGALTAATMPPAWQNVVTS